MTVEELRTDRQGELLYGVWLYDHHKSKRFTHEEKWELAQVMREKWNGLLDEVRREGIVHYSLDGVLNRDRFNMQEIKMGVSLVNEPVRRVLGERLWLTWMMQDEGSDFEAVQAWMEYEGITGAVLATPFFPGGRQDRECELKGESMLPLMGVKMKNLRRSGIKGLVTVDGHSPFIALQGWHAEMAVLDVTALPLLLDRAVELRGLRKDNYGGKLAVVNPDDGSLEVGLLARDLLARRTGRTPDEIVWVPGIKKKNSEVKVRFGHELECVEGAEVLFVDDNISTANTTVASLEQVLKQNPRHVTGLITHTVCLPGKAGEPSSVDRLVQLDGGRMSWVVTNAKEPQVPIDRLPDLEIVKLEQPLEMLMRLTLAGHSPWDTEGAELFLDEAGLVLNPWQTYDIRQAL